MHRPARILTTAAVATAFTALLVSQAGHLDPVALAAAIGLVLLAAATTVHAIIRPARREPIDEAYERSYERVSGRFAVNR
ncbi:hypothetical protein FAF44_02725 [Nonomuraea sp. MG754425]|uniref:hypothetical protein n=1 Tax=Nonomuraea sp. MG754425 TaxID=2570319 RepID=UPI001F16E40B|nr:hypothetical protein [Nonomuraea sp. MG754425]MCF6467328.1 hypothetical protein [Nonomuraea sp. MG754425]